MAKKDVKKFDKGPWDANDSLQAPFIYEVKQNGGLISEEIDEYPRADLPKRIAVYEYDGQKYRIYEYNHYPSSMELIGKSTKKSKMKKSLTCLDDAENSLWELLENIDYVRASEGGADKQTLDVWYDWANEIATCIQSSNDSAYSASAKKSKLSKEYRVNADRDIDIDIMAGELTVRVSDTQSGWAKNKQIDVMNLPWQIVGDITEILGENWNDIPEFVAIENALVSEYDEEWKAFNEQMRNKSTKKSVPKSKDTKMSFTDNVNKMRVNNYAKTGNINTVMKKRD